MQKALVLIIFGIAQVSFSMELPEQKQEEQLPDELIPPPPPLERQYAYDNSIAMGSRASLANIPEKKEQEPQEAKVADSKESADIELD